MNSSFNSTSTISSYGSECFICNEEREEPAMSLMDYEIKRTCACSAKLHAQCYSRWLSQSNSCPVCRNPILIDNVNQEIQVYTAADVIENPQPKTRVSIIIIYVIIVMISIALITIISIL